MLNGCARSVTAKKIHCPIAHMGIYIHLKTLTYSGADGANAKPATVRVMPNAKR